ncbi:MAG: DNA repair protein RecO [Oscillospiraceae bacterium]|nr:DNA repair protein RecO [Oscillospiraceae bacterium]
MFKTTKALVLRETKYKEADKILTVLTSDEGKITVKARGALRKSCKYSAASQMLCYSEMTLFGNKGKWSINEAETIEQFLPLRADIELLSLGAYFAEMLEAVSDEDIPNPEILQLGLNSLYALSRGMYSPAHIKAVFELRLMCLSGFEPDLYGCVSCGEEEIEDALFSIRGGVIHCRGCNPGSPGISMPVCREAIAAMRYICFSEPKKIFSFSIPENAQKQLYDVAEAYVASQLERGFSSLDYWKSISYRG